MLTDSNEAFNPWNAKRQTTKFTPVKFQKWLIQGYIILRIQILEGKSAALDEAAHYEPSHLDLHCLPNCI